MLFFFVMIRRPPVSTLTDTLLPYPTPFRSCNGACAALVVSEQALKDHGLTPRARIHHISVTAGDPIIMLEEPLFATERALKKAGMTIGDIDVYEVNEAFAPVPLAWLQYLGGDHARLNQHGGAIVLGPQSEGRRVGTECVSPCRFRWGRLSIKTIKQQ